MTVDEFGCGFPRVPTLVVVVCVLTCLLLAAALATAAWKSKSRVFMQLPWKRMCDNSTLHLCLFMADVTIFFTGFVCAAKRGICIPSWAEHFWDTNALRNDSFSGRTPISLSSESTGRSSRVKEEFLCYKTTKVKLISQTWENLLVKSEVVVFVLVKMILHLLARFVFVHSKRSLSFFCCEISGMMKNSEMASVFVGDVCLLFVYIILRRVHWTSESPAILSLVGWSLFLDGLFTSTHLPSGAYLALWDAYCFHDETRNCTGNFFFPSKT